MRYSIYFLALLAPVALAAPSGYVSRGSSSSSKSSSSSSNSGSSSSNQSNNYGSSSSSNNNNYGSSSSNNYGSSSSSNNYGSSSNNNYNGNSNSYNNGYNSNSNSYNNNGNNYGSFSSYSSSSSSSSSDNSNDILVLQFADVLEQAESTFYQQALQKFQSSDFTDAGFNSPNLAIQQFQAIQSDESTHAGAIEAALQSLGASGIQGCQFNFDSVLTDVNTMAATARVVENLGVAAYLGAAPLVSDPVLLDAAASIMTVEARHSTVLNIFSGSGSAIPQAFDIPLAPNEVLAVAGQFISGCNIPIQGNTPLTITTQGTPQPGTQLSFSASSIQQDTSNLFCQMLVGGAPFAISLPFDQCIVPSGINGPVALFVTNDQTPLVNNVRDRNQQQIVAGPTLVFIDTQPEELGQGVRQSSGSSSSSSSSSNSSSSSDSSNSSSSSSNSSDSSSSSSSSSSDSSNTDSSNEGITTQTISPDQASSIIAQAASTAGATDGGASPTDSASSAQATSDNSSSSGVDNVSQVSQGPNLATGTQPNGAITVNGWSGLNSTSTSN